MIMKKNLILIAYYGDSLLKSEIDNIAMTIAPRVKKNHNLTIKDVSDDKLAEILTFPETTSSRISSTKEDKIIQNITFVFNECGDIREIDSVTFVLNVLLNKNKDVRGTVHWLINQYQEHYNIMQKYGIDNNIILALKRAL